MDIKVLGRGSAVFPCTESRAHAQAALKSLLRNVAFQSCSSVSPFARVCRSCFFNC